MNARIGNRVVKIPDGQIAVAPKAKDESRYRNKAEGAHALYLLGEVEAGRVKRWAYEPINILLPGGQRYTPDFVVWLNDRTVEIHEVKGSRHMKNARDGLTRCRVAAGITFWATFKLFTKEKGLWRETVIAP